MRVVLVPVIVLDTVIVLVLDQPLLPFPCHAWTCVEDENEYEYDHEVEYDDDYAHVSASVSTGPTVGHSYSEENMPGTAWPSD